jgi:hypothetical protein
MRRMLLAVIGLFLISTISGCSVRSFSKTKCCSVSSDGGVSNLNCYTTYSKTCKTGYKKM